MQLTDTTFYVKLMFLSRFRLDHLVHSGSLPLLKVIELLPTARDMSDGKTSDVVAHSKSSVFEQVAIAKPKNNREE